MPPHGAPLGTSSRDFLRRQRFRPILPFELDHEGEAQPMPREVRMVADDCDCAKALGSF
jgi:hypothetical protein